MLWACLTPPSTLPADPSTGWASERCSFPAPACSGRPRTAPRRSPYCAGSSRRGSTTSTPRSSTAPTWPTSSSGRLCTPIQSNWSWSRRSVPFAMPRGQWLGAQRPEELRAGVEANLASLEVDQIPVVNLRRHLGTDVPFSEPQVEAMKGMCEEGLIGGLGLSNVGPPRRVPKMRWLSLTDIACVQNAYNTADRSGQDVFDVCRVDGGPLCAVLPLGLGLRSPTSRFCSPPRGPRDGTRGSLPRRPRWPWPGFSTRRPPCSSFQGHLHSNTSRRTWRRLIWRSTTRRWRRWAETFQQGKPKRKDDGIGSLVSAPVVERDDRRSADCRGRLWR